MKAIIKDEQIPIKSNWLIITPEEKAELDEAVQIASNDKNAEVRQLYINGHTFNLEIKKEELRFGCPICGNRFVDIEMLGYHMRGHDPTILGNYVNSTMD